MAKKPDDIEGAPLDTQDGASVAPKEESGSIPARCLTAFEHGGKTYRGNQVVLGPRSTIARLAQAGRVDPDADAVGYCVKELGAKPQALESEG